MIIMLRKKSVKWLIAAAILVIIFVAFYDKGEADESAPTVLVMAEGTLMAEGDEGEGEGEIEALPSEEKTVEDDEPSTDIQPLQSIEENPPTIETETEMEETETAAQKATALRLERNQNRSWQKGQLEEMIGNDHISQASRYEAEQKLLQLNDQSAMELQTETLLKTKGYDQSVVLVDHGKATIYITTDLVGEDFNKIGDLVQTSTNFSLEQIIIIPK